MRRLLAIACLIIAGTGAAQAQSMEDRLRAQLSSVTAQLRTVQDNQATLEAQKSAAERERDDLRTQLSNAQKGMRAAQRHTQTAPVAADSDQQKKLAAALSEVSRLMQINAALVSDKEHLSKEAADKESSVGLCQTKNAQAVRIAQQLLLAYRNVGFGDILAKNEPLTGLDRVEFEQLEQDFGDKIYNSQLAVPIGTGTAPEPAPQTKH